MRLLPLLLLASSLLFAEINLPENFQANFIQKITNPKKQVIRYSGKVRFSDEKRFKWSYSKPTKKEVCTDGFELMVVDHDLEQVSIYRITNGLDIAKILKKAKVHSKNVYVARYENKQYTIQVDSRQKLQSIAYFDDLDNKVQIVFKAMRYGKGNLPLKDMQCNFPRSYDMIRG
jgi:outer membrane lipoprotein carrier protein